MQQIKTPYGEFKSFSAACRYIMQTNAPDFIRKYPFDFPYTGVVTKMPGNNSAQHNVYNAIKKMVDSNNYPDWQRI